MEGPRDLHATPAQLTDHFAELLGRLRTLNDKLSFEVSKIRREIFDLAEGESTMIERLTQDLMNSVMEKQRAHPGAKKFIEDCALKAMQEINNGTVDIMKACNGQENLHKLRSKMKEIYFLMTYIDRSLAACRPINEGAVENTDICLQEAAEEANRRVNEITKSSVVNFVEERGSVLQCIQEAIAREEKLLKVALEYIETCSGEHIFDAKDFHEHR